MIMDWKLTIVKLAQIPLMDYRFSMISASILGDFVEIDKLTLKSIGNCKGFRIAKAVLKKNKVGGLSLLDFKMYYKARVIRTVWYWQKDRHRDLRTESPEVNSYICSQLIVS